MDRIDGLNGALGVQFPGRQDNSSNVQNQQAQGKQPPPPPFNVELTQLGQSFSAVEESGESAKSALKQFHENLFEALQSGNFDTVDLLEDASEEIKMIAEEAGIDLTAALTEFAEKAGEMNGRPGPPPGGKPKHGPPPPEELVSASADEESEDTSTTSVLD